MPEALVATCSACLMLVYSHRRLLRCVSSSQKTSGTTLRFSGTLLPDCNEKIISDFLEGYPQFCVFTFYNYLVLYFIAAGAYYLYFFLNSVGVRLTYFPKTLQKYFESLKPQLSAICAMCRFVSSSIFLDSSIRRLFT